MGGGGTRGPRPSACAATGDARGALHTGYGLAEHVRGGMVPIVPYDGGQAPLLVVGDVRRTDAVAGCG